MPKETLQNISDKILLILDLDETLIHATVDNLDLQPDFEVFNYKVFKRPYLDRFLINCSKEFKIAIWSSASDDYVEAVVKQIIPDSIKLEFVWGRSRATYKPAVYLSEYGYLGHDHYQYIKRLKKIKTLGFKLEKALIVDDTPHKSIENYGNAIYVREFTGEKADNELLQLENYLMEIKHTVDVRKVEKRGWKFKNESRV